MLIKIKSWITGEILHSLESDSLKTALEFLVKQGASLDGAFLNGAFLNGASLNGAFLDRASLNGAFLDRASLDGASLNGAFLDRASLDGAFLNGASLNGASLNGASLDRAFLDGAKIGDLSFLTELSDAIDLAPMIWQEWKVNGLEKARDRFGLHQVSGEKRALIAMCPRLQGGYAFILPRREIWWWSWTCPNPETVPVLWREADYQ